MSSVQDPGEVHQKAEGFIRQVSGALSQNQVQDSLVSISEGQELLRVWGYVLF